jgi:adenine-specific DNA-methyltransferase
MATGIPSSSKGASAKRAEYEIQYSGKAPAVEIRKGPEAQLNTVLSVGPAPRNTVIYGENARVLRSLAKDAEILGCVRTIYIDPPFASQARYESRIQEHAYLDHMKGAEYLEFLRERLILCKDLLASDGSIYVHLDDKMVFQVKVLMDEIFGESNFRNVITRKKCNPKNYTRKQFGNVTDFILFYAKTKDNLWNPQHEPLSDERSASEYRYVEESTGRKFMKVPIHAPGVRNGETGQEWRGMLPPPGKHWQYRPSTLEEMNSRGEIVWSASGNPRRKVYLDQRPGVPVQNIWLDHKDAHNQNICITGYPTEKNADVLRRIISASTNPGDLVLDFFAGSGTTASVAEELGRRWIAVDNSLLAIQTIMSRLGRGTEPMGDYVTGQAVRSLSLFSRILRSGLDLKLEQAEDLDDVTEAQVREWSELLAP